MDCAAVDVYGTQWNFCPNLGAAVFFLVLFVLTAAAHLAQAVRHRAVSYCWVVVVSAVWQALTYALRTASIRTPTSFGLYAAWFVLILVAPLWTNAFAYMVFGRLVWSQTPARAVWGLPAARFGLVFVVLDIVAFVVQVVGAALAAGSDDGPDPDTVLRGLHIYMAGVGIQLLFILVCAAFGLRLAAVLRTARDPDPKHHARVMRLVAVQFSVLVLIIIRIVFRIVEYSSGLDSSVPRHEAFQYCLDTLPMFLALALYNAVHPGSILSRADSKMPSWRQRRQQRKLQRQTALELGSRSGDE